MPPTITEVAKRAGTAVSTASVALRGAASPGRISPETRKRILKIAREMGYSPNFFASQMRRPGAGILMLWVNSLQDMHATTIAQGFERYASAKGYRTILSVANSMEPANSLNSGEMMTQGVAAMAMVGASCHAIQSDVIEALLDRSVHVLQIGREVDDPRLSHVVSDEVYGCTEAASYLINQGLQDLWVLDPWPTPGASPRRRVAAIMDAAEKMGIRPPRILRIPNTDDPIMIARNAYESVRAGIASYGLPEGIFTLSDMRAYGVFRAVAEAGARIGVDVAIVGHDDIVFSEMLRPSLTTVAQPMLEMGAKAAECLIEGLEGRAQPGHRVMLRPHLVIRESGWCFPQRRAENPAWRDLQPKNV